ncbi:hypothetical protein M3649_20375 [Ureibacillus chungkukjangi]|uniref:ImmA/IrrE family metallo-endopeptidase n=1 Tax=Ureibacillus chungkukjangi TaxID=1202712 RepID=UPI00203E1F74|nr:hypothetical protein [Ureibacillus chungkukjangi]MCM3390448.1 hypothetical protein [Ureibacillus chungkukjangi]
MRITGENLDTTVEANKRISREITSHIQSIDPLLSKYRKMSPEKRAIQILEDHYLIQIPIPDVDWGGAIKELPNGFKVPVINTAQPRLYQYFIYWHEIYHLTETDSLLASHDISTEFDLTERKADYFASQMLMGQELYIFYFDIDEKEADFIHRIARCMDAFKAPYKAVLIQLYELAIKYKNTELQDEIKKNFDKSLTRQEWITIFKHLSLDETLVEPSLIVDLGKLKNLVDEKSKESPDDRAYSETKIFVDELEKKFLFVKGTIESGAI